MAIDQLPHGVSLSFVDEGKGENLQVR